MSRIARIVVPGCPHHVTQRGNRREPIFFEDGDQDNYRDLLAEQVGKARIEVWAYCLMPNHVHLIVVPHEEAGFARAIGEAHRRYTNVINAWGRWTGHLFQNRFASVPMDDAHFVTAVPYVSLNPVRARLVVKAEEWAWSSVRAHLAACDDNLVSVKPVLDRVGDFARLLAPNIADEERFAMVRRCENNGRPLATEEFVAALERILGRPIARRAPGRKLQTQASKDCCNMYGVPALLGIVMSTKTVGYDALGNILSKSDVGTYTYPAAGQARPHAVTSISGTVNGVTNPSYGYDANGNLNCVYASSGSCASPTRSISSTSFNMANTITQGTTSVTFAYDEQHQRITQSATSSGTTTYLNDPQTGTASEVVGSGSTAVWHDFITAGGAIVAERFCTGAAPCSSGATLRYFVADQLGSTAALTDQTGAVTERLSYDGWGRRRNANGTDDTTCSITSATTRGFTAQEHIDSMCTINFNARVYDPTLGRFMSADTVVPNAYDGQSYNRFAYVENGPLSQIDPSGHIGAGVASSATAEGGVPGVFGGGASGTTINGAFSGGLGSSSFGGAWVQGSSNLNSTSNSANGSVGAFAGVSPIGFFASTANSASAATAAGSQVFSINIGGVDSVSVTAITTPDGNITVIVSVGGGLGIEIVNSHIPAKKQKAH